MEDISRKPIVRLLNKNKEPYSGTLRVSIFQIQPEFYDRITNWYIPNKMNYILSSRRKLDLLCGNST